MHTPTHRPACWTDETDDHGRPTARPWKQGDDARYCASPDGERCNGCVRKQDDWDGTPEGLEARICQPPWRDDAWLTEVCRLAYEHNDRGTMNMLGCEDVGGGEGSYSRIGAKGNHPQVHGNPSVSAKIRRIGNHPRSARKRLDVLNRIWDHVPPEYNYVVRDYDGDVLAFTHEPELGSHFYDTGWTCLHPDAGGLHCYTLDDLPDWADNYKDSLIVRPSNGSEQ